MYQCIAKFNVAHLTNYTIILSLENGGFAHYKDVEFVDIFFFPSKYTQYIFVFIFTDIFICSFIV